VRIDRADLADEPGSADMARYARSSPDNQEAAGKEYDRAVGGDGPLDSSPAAVNSALRIERSTAYRAAVDAAYRQYAIDHGAHNADALGSWARETAPADAPTGARGPASGREFDPEAAGGPIRPLDAGNARITDEGVQEVAAHLRRFTGGSSLDAPEQGMLDRLMSIASGAMKPTSYDLNFFTHELDEAGRYAQLGFGPESGVDLGSSEMYEVWNDAHTAALEDYGISDAGLFYPGTAS
jgi:hypothetical protein